MDVHPPVWKCGGRHILDFSSFSIICTRIKSLAGYLLVIQPVRCAMRTNMISLLFWEFTFRSTSIFISTGDVKHFFFFSLRIFGKKCHLHYLLVIYKLPWCNFFHLWGFNIIIVSTAATPITSENCCTVTFIWIPELQNLTLYVFYNNLLELSLLKFSSPHFNHLASYILYKYSYIWRLHIKLVNDAGPKIVVAFQLTSI
jgi:hypothetical protein